MTKGTFYKWAELPQTAMTPQIKRRLVTGEKVMSVYFTLDKGAVIGEHKHPHEQITHILSGEIEFEVGGEKQVMHSGEVLHIPPQINPSGWTAPPSIGREVLVSRI